MSDALALQHVRQNPDRPTRQPWRRRLRSLLSWTAGAYLLTAFTATHLPLPGGVPVGLAHADKVVHFTIFTGLSLLIVAWRITRFDSPQRAAATAFALCLLYGAADELSQLLVAGREPDRWDLFADACGALIGLAAFPPLLRWWPRST